MPIAMEEMPDKYAQCMRLLLLASAMKSFDVVVLMMQTDAENLRMFELVTAMRQMLRYVTRVNVESDLRPQIVVPLINEQLAQAREL